MRFPQDTSRWDGGDGAAFVGYVLVKHDGGFYDVAAEMFERHVAG